MSLLRLTVLFLGMTLTSGAAQAKDCVNWPQVMSRGSIAGTTSGKMVTVEPFTDYTKVAGDEWFSAGLRDLAASMLAASGSLRVYAGPHAVYNQEAKSPDFVVSGMFQRLDGGLRVFVKLTAADGKLLAQYGYIASYPESSELFIRLADIVKQMWKVMGVSGSDSELAGVRDATPSTRAFESYSKGRQTLDSYKLSDIEVAKTWFEQAKRNDYASPLGYRGMIDLYTFLGFYHKQRSEPYGNYFEQAEREFTDMLRIAKRPPAVWRWAKKPTKKEETKVSLSNSYLLSNAAYKEGVIAAEGGRWPEAADAFKRATEYLPEDAVAWYHLARAYENSGRPVEASAALQKAYEINPCLGK